MEGDEGATTDAGGFQRRRAGRRGEAKVTVSQQIAASPDKDPPAALLGTWGLILFIKVLSLQDERLP